MYALWHAIFSHKENPHIALYHIMTYETERTATAAIRVVGVSKYICTDQIRALDFAVVNTKMISSRGGFLTSAMYHHM